MIAGMLSSLAARADDFHIRGSAIVRGGKPVVLRGVNAMHVFGGDGADLTTWPGITIVREFVGDLKDEPLEPGSAYHDKARNWYLHSLQDVVSHNEARGIVSIVCPWTMDTFKETDFCGSIPIKAAWYADYKSRMRDWARQFKGQKMVWIEVMNEPFVILTTPQDDALWLSSMSDMVDNLRSAGWDGIIVVPGSAWGQDETVIERMGPALLKGRRDILFDVHIYERWLSHPSTIDERIAAIKASRLPFIFAELGPQNNVNFDDPKPFIAAAQKNKLSVLAWGWGTYGKRSPGNLQTNEGGPYDVDNFGWGSAYKSFLAGSSTEVK